MYQRQGLLVVLQAAWVGYMTGVSSKGYKGYTQLGIVGLLAFRVYRLVGLMSRLLGGDAMVLIVD